MDPLISVIVPIYNVEKYVRKCLDSLKNQSLKQIEVICIDDGSTDDSGRIADEYGREDPRFRIIHTENRGLSAVRNRGIEESRCDWIMFVDSDDWVEKDFCEIPYKAAVENKADMVVFRNDVIKQNREKKYKTANDLIGLVDEFTAHEHGARVAWNKLYKKELFDGIQYPEGRVYEDVSTTHQLVHKAKRIFMLSDCLYHYCLRR